MYTPGDFMPTVSPFDSIGSPIQEPVSPLEALELGNLNFEVVLEPVKNSRNGDVILGEPDDDGQITPKYYQVMRDDTSDVLGIVEGRFSPLQNSTVFPSAASLLLAHGARITRVAEIERGARCFMTLEWNDSMDIHGDRVAFLNMPFTEEKSSWPLFVENLK
jgi:hypothetical protein